jgi:hypothetical protein
MNGRIILKAAALCCLLLLQTSCSQVAITGRKQLNIVPDSMMNSMALQSYNEFLTDHKLSGNSQQTAMVKNVGARIQVPWKSIAQSITCLRKSEIIIGSLILLKTRI